MGALREYNSIGCLSPRLLYCAEYLLCWQQSPMLSPQYGTLFLRGPVSQLIGETNGNPIQYSCLGNPMDTGAWHGVARVRHNLMTKPPLPPSHVLNPSTLYRAMIHWVADDINHNYEFPFLVRSILISTSTECY